MFGQFVKMYFLEFQLESDGKRRIKQVRRELKNKIKKNRNKNGNKCVKQSDKHEV